MTLAQAALQLPSISWAAIAPEIVLSVGGALVLLVEVQWRPATKVLGGVVAAVVAAAGGLAVWQWSRVDAILAMPDTTGGEFFGAFLPFGQMIAFDHSAVLGRLALLAVTALGVAGGWRLFERLGSRAAEALALVLLSAAGFSLMAASVHLVMVFLGLEVGSIALYVLAGITRERQDSDEAAIKYFLLGSVASAVFVYGVALVFAATGEFNLLAIRSFLAENQVFRPAVLLIGMALLIVGMGFKVSAAPFHTWAPDVYQGAPAGVVGYMAGAAKIGGFAALARILFSGFPRLTDDWGVIVAGVAALSMLVGALFAVVQDDVRRMLAYSGVAHAGFILTGVVGGAAGAAGMWFYLAVYTIQLVGAFAVVAAVSGAATPRSSIASFRGLARRSPFLAAPFTVLLLGMAGLPLTSGFIAKFGVFRQAWQAGYEWLVIVAVLASVIAFFFYLRVIVVMYMEEQEEAAAIRPAASVRWVLAAASLLTLLLGVLPGPLLDLAGDALPL